MFIVMKVEQFNNKFLKNWMKKNPVFIKNIL